MAKWYDYIAVANKDSKVSSAWKRERPALVEDWTARLMSDPHSGASSIDAQIERARGRAGEHHIEKTFRALQASSRAFELMGFDPILKSSANWASMRAHWSTSGNLLRSGGGHLLPRRPRRYSWQGWPSEVKNYDAQLIWPGFLRVRETTGGVEVRCRVSPSIRVPWERLEKGIRIGIVPLVQRLPQHARSLAPCQRATRPATRN